MKTKFGFFLLLILVSGSAVYLYLPKEEKKEVEKENTPILNTQENFVTPPEEVKVVEDENQQLPAIAIENVEVKPETPKTTLEDRSRADEIQYFENKPVGYADPRYSNIVGYNQTIGITMSIPAGIVPSIIEDKSLEEVVAYRFEDGLNKEYNDVFIIFSCFEAGVPVLEKNIPYIDFSQNQEVKHIYINGIDYYHMQYDDFFMLADTQYVGPFNSNWDIFGCGLYMVGKELSEVHISFLQNLSYIESRDAYFKNIYNKFLELYE